VTLSACPRPSRPATRSDGMKLPPELTRKLWLLKIASQLPAPSDAKERTELAEIEVGMTGMYGKGKYCPARLANDPKAKKKCLALVDLENLLEHSRKWDELLEAWR